MELTEKTATILRAESSGTLAMGLTPPHLIFAKALLFSASTIPSSELGKEAQGGGSSEEATLLGSGGWVSTLTVLLQNLSSNCDVNSTSSHHD